MDKFEQKTQINKLIEHLKHVAQQLNATNCSYEIITLKKKLYEAIDRNSNPQ
jgi:hypothetical protein